MQSDLRDDDLDPELRPRHRLRAPILAVLVMAASAGGVWVAYTHGRNGPPAEVPLIQADQGATKARPSQPGGMAIPDQDKLVYTQGKSQQAEKLLPPPETPLPRPAPPPAPEAPPAASTPPSTGGLAAAPPAPPPADVAPPAPPPTPTPATASSPPSSAGAHRLQLGAFRSREAARQEWEKLHKAHGDLLRDLAAVWPRADLGDRGVYYRIQTTPIADAATAERLCGELKRRKVACIVVRP